MGVDYRDEYGRSDLDRMEGENERYGYLARQRRILDEAFAVERRSFKWELKNAIQDVIVFIVCVLFGLTLGLPLFLACKIQDYYERKRGKIN